MQKTVLDKKDKDLLAGLHKLKDELQALKEELGSEHSDNSRVEKNIRFLTSELFSEAESGRTLIRRANEIPSKEVHYNRNRLMPVNGLPQSPEMAAAFGWDSSVGAACHQFTSPDRSNIKYVSPDGHSEVIFDHDGHIVTASEDYGTYNFGDSRQDPVGHFYRDILPWLLWGNDEMDSTDMRQRLRALVIYGGIEAAQTHKRKESAKSELPQS